MIRTYDFASGELIFADQPRHPETVAPLRAPKLHCPAPEPRLQLATDISPEAPVALPADLATFPVSHFLASQG